MEEGRWWSWSGLGEGWRRRTRPLWVGWGDAVRPPRAARHAAYAARACRSPHPTPPPHLVHPRHHRRRVGLQPLHVLLGELARASNPPIAAITRASRRCCLHRRLGSRGGLWEGSSIGGVADARHPHAANPRPPLLRHGAGSLWRPRLQLVPLTLGAVHRGAIGRQRGGARCRSGERPRECTPLCLACLAPAPLPAPTRISWWLDSVRRPGACASAHRACSADARAAHSPPRQTQRGGAAAPRRPAAAAPAAAAAMDDITFDFEGALEAQQPTAGPGQVRSWALRWWGGGGSGGRGTRGPRPPA